MTDSPRPTRGTIDVGARPSPRAGVALDPNTRPAALKRAERIITDFTNYPDDMVISQCHIVLNHCPDHILRARAERTIEALGNPKAHP